MAIVGLEPVYQNIPTWDDSNKKDSKDELGLNQFLNMLVAQLKHQDPLNPMDGTDFTAQLAQFSALEQQFQMNSSLAEIQNVLSAQQKGNAIDYIGKTVKTLDNTLVVKGGQVDTGVYRLSGRAQVSLYLYDSRGMEVRKIYKGWQDAGEYEIEWDGRDNEGNPISDGTYQVEVVAEDDQGLVIPISTYVSGEVTGVTYRDGFAYLMVDDRAISPSAIVEVNDAGNSHGQE
ncbi:MAG: flagellar hook assembly protein FlgD [Deltaproteobacteria bacterium]|nr:flagellar hook assembly protein FlgD [Deltaproteobacteria bacterium]